MRSIGLASLAALFLASVVAATPKPPLFFWAQSDSTVYLTLKYSLRDVSYSFTQDSLIFRGVDTHKHHDGDEYEMQLNFFKPIRLGILNLAIVIYLLFGFCLFVFCFRPVVPVH